MYQGLLQAANDVKAALGVGHVRFSWFSLV